MSADKLLGKLHKSLEGMLLLSLVVTPYLLQAAPLEADRMQYDGDAEDIRALSQRKGIVNHDAEVEKLATKIRGNWEKRNPERYRELVLKLCGEIESGRLGKARQHGLARKYAIELLAKRDALDIDTEFKLVGHLGEPAISSQPVSAAEWGTRRREDSDARLHLWKRVADSIDPQWNPKDPANTPALSVLPPKQGSKTGEEYQVEVEKNKKKAQRNYEQRQRRKQIEKISVRTEEFIASAYGTAPFADDEIRGLLNTYIADLAAKERILKAIEARKTKVPGVQLKKPAGDSPRKIIQGVRKKAVPVTK